VLVAESLYEDSQFPYPIKEILSDFTKIVVRYYSLPGKKNFTLQITPYLLCDFLDFA